MWSDEEISSVCETDDQHAYNSSVCSYLANLCTLSLALSLSLSLTERERARETERMLAKRQLKTNVNIGASLHLPSCSRATDTCLGLGPAATVRIARLITTE